MFRRRVITSFQRVRGLARISVLLPTAFLAVTLATAWLVSTVWLHAMNQSRVLTELADRDTNIRLSTRSVVIVSETLNTRLLGVLGDVYSAPGSVLAIQKIFDDLQGHWSALMRHTEKTESGVRFDQASLQLERIVRLRPDAMDALRGGSRSAVSKVYDDLLEPMTLFRRQLREILSNNDRNGSEKIAGVLHNSEWLERLAKMAGGFIVMIAVLAGLYVIFEVARPLASLTRSMKSIAANDVEAAVVLSNRIDEIGDMSKALDVFKASQIERNQYELRKKEAEIAWQSQRRRDLDKLAQSLEAAVGQALEIVNSSASELVLAVGTLTSTADETQRRSGSVRIASEQTSSNIERIASSTHELASSAGEVRRHIEEAGRITQQAASSARVSRERIQKLSDATKGIVEMVQQITAVAKQTNLLALNATIEAARAGAAGKGFSVVAAEVKALAVQAANVSHDIIVLVEGMKAATCDSVDDIDRVGAIIDRIADVAKLVNDLIQSQEAATREIAVSSQHVASGAVEVAKDISEVSRGASETGTASDQVRAAAHNLAAEGKKLKGLIENMAATIKAA